MKYGDPRNEELHFVYRVFDADGVLLYVGCTRDPEGRFKYHRSRAKWWSEADRTEWTPVGNLYAAQRYEEQVIKTERPLYNFQHNSPSAHGDGTSEPWWRQSAFRQGGCRRCADARTAVDHKGMGCVAYARERIRAGKGCVHSLDHAMRILERAADLADAEAAA